MNLYISQKSDHIEIGVYSKGEVLKYTQIYYSDYRSIDSARPLLDLIFRSIELLKIEGLSGLGKIESIVREKTSYPNQIWMGSVTLRRIFDGLCEAFPDPRGSHHDTN